MYRWLVVLLALGSMGCATATGALLGAALCGDSGGCRDDFVRAGAATDVAIAGAVAQSAVEDARRDRRDPDGDYRWGGEGRAYGGRTTGGEYTTPAASEYFHCVDADGRHVLETVAPSGEPVGVRDCELWVQWHYEEDPHAEPGTRPDGMPKGSASLEAQVVLHAR